MFPISSVTYHGDVIQPAYGDREGVALEDDSTGWPCSQFFLIVEIHRQATMASILPSANHLEVVSVIHSQRPNAERVFFDERRPHLAPLGPVLAAVECMSLLVTQNFGRHWLNHPSLFELPRIDRRRSYF